MNAAVVKRTQEALGKVIRRPPLTEKLLNKPPFRYLHDIITEVIRVTGFMKGLYTDAEMKSDNVKDKDAKISFLQKAIDVVVMVSGEPLSAKPVRIVAGHEPERTNELLQRIGKCCLSKLSSDDAVKRVLAGERGDAKARTPLTSKSQGLDNRNAREEGPGVREDKEDKRYSEINEEGARRDQKQREEVKEESKARDKDKDKDKDKTTENDRERHKEPERDKCREGERERARNRAKQDRDRGTRERDKDVERARERRSEAGKEERRRERERERERDKGRDRDRDRRRGKDGDHSRNPDREESREHDKPERKSSNSGEVSKKLSDGSVKDSKAETETEVSTRASGSVTAKMSKRRSKNSMEGTKEANTNSASVSDDNSASLRREHVEPGPAVKRKGDSPSDTEEVGPSVQEKSELPSELPANIRKPPRPGSARPAPPRVKRQDGAEALTADRTGSGKAVASVIVDAQNSDGEEDDQFVVEAAPQLPEMSELEVVPAVDMEEEEKHGGLVKKILETKKDYEKLQQPPRPGEKEKLLVSESAWKKEKDIVSKEIEKLRVSIQTLCKSALPLGKIMDYIQEDVDAMQNELQLWHSENKQHAEALQEEQSITDCAVEPLKAELAELEQLIRDQQDKICAVKANILRNDEKIQKMVCSITLSSRR
ncbi:TRAF3-interacting protein 1 isoform X4 [Prionailurus bengalensis]|uniref:TRAF3-interacting protein 1 isoform X4 n=1 Tax=Prionailurus bengalensis TaxID=37029 RepID=UPI001CA9A2E3|nr:TRAF3-interacting protein 1 isoform X4 [Prionailurus bengalensis]